MQAVGRNLCQRMRPIGFASVPSTGLPKLWIRKQHEAVVGIRDQYNTTGRDEFDIIKEQTKKLFEKPKKDRGPFIKNLFLDKVDPTMLEYPEVTQDEMDDLMRQLDPIAMKTKTVDPSKIDQNAVMPDDVLSDLRHSGAFVHLIPRTHNGNDLNMTGYTAVVEAVSLDGNATLGTWTYTMGSWVSRTLEEHGTEEQRAHYLPLIASGEASMALCVSEAKCGSNVAAMETSVRLGPDNKGYIITGKKSWVINAPKCDYFIVIAKHLGIVMDPKYSSPEIQFSEDKTVTGSMSAFIVPKKAPGASIGDLRPLVGLRGLQVSELVLNEVALPLNSLIGKTGGGFQIAMQAVSMERHIFGSIMLPLVKNLLDKATVYVAERHIFNRALTEFQLIQHKLVESAYLIYALESMTYLTSQLIDTTIHPEFDMESAAVRIFAADIAPKIVQNIREIYGALGATTDTHFDLAYRDLLTLAQLDGGTDIARLYVALSGFQYAGIVQVAQIQKHNNPFSYPRDAMRTAFERMGLARKRPKVNLDYYVHPSLGDFARQLEVTCAEFGQITENFLLTYHKDLLHRQVELKKVSDMAVTIYGMFAALGRCSRAYCVGMKNNAQEMNLGMLFVLHGMAAVHQQWLEFSSDSYNRQSLIETTAKHMIKEKGYGVEHPLTRNY